MQTLPQSIALHDMRGPAAADPCGCQAFISGELRIRAASMLRVHGYSHPDDAPTTIRHLAETIAAQATSFCTATAWHREIAVEGYGGRALTLGGGRVVRCREFNELAGCPAVVVFVLTLGSGIDTEVARYTNAGELLEALFLETAAWLAIEQATRALVISLRDGAAARGLALTRRFAPGYADWALIEQKLLFSYLGTKGKAFPVELLDSGAMVPNMSRTGMYGLRRLI